MTISTDSTTELPRTRKSYKQRRLRPALLRRESAARYCAVGASTWDRLTAAGLTPAPIRLGGSVGWSRRELTAWIEHRCPNRADWEPIWRAIRQAHATH